MAIKQNSKIQHRRGLAVDLPNPLEPSEIGHVVDERRVYIGNGEIANGAPEVGNTEILTEYAPNGDLIKHIYKSNTAVEAVTGPTANDPIIRSLQEVLDDRLSVKAYGVVGDGVTDDSQEINRALENIYTVAIPVVPSQGYRVLFFPAGEYLLNAEQINLPPNTILIGEGIDRTIIRMVDATKASAIRTADSDFQTDIQLGNGGADLPSNIHIFGMTIQHDGDKDVLSLERASNITIDYCKFTNGWSGGASTSELVHIDPLGAVYEHKNIRFLNCQFDNGGYATNLPATASNANELYFVNCRFRNLFRGIRIDVDALDIKITNSIFEDIEQTALYAAPEAMYVSSQNNTYRNCGDLTNPVIVFDAAGPNEAFECSSMNDRFISPGNEILGNYSKSTLFLNPNLDFVFGNLNITSKKPSINLQDNMTNASTGISFDVSETDTVFLSYSLKRDGFSRSGQIFLVSDGTVSGTNIGDLFSESGPTGVTFDFNLAGSTVTILYTTTSTGSNAEMHYQHKSWLMG